MNKIISLLALTISLQTQAADRALIIGITDYQQAKYRLPGIDLDVEMAQNMAQMLNFSPNQIHTLKGVQATAKNIKHAISTWLVQDVKDNDRVFLYYSGHGGQFTDQNGDEQDGNDEYITAYDLGDDVHQGGYILDDEMAILLAKIPSHYKIVLMDSCHSGTTTRSIVPKTQILGGNRLYSKLHYFGKSPVRSNSDKNTKINSFIEGAPNTLVFAASQDNESARADKNGSLFTLGVYQALEQAAQQGAKLQPKDLITKSQQYIAKVLSAKGDEEAIHHPIIFGDKALVNKQLILKPSRNRQGPNWQDLTKLAKLSNPNNQLKAKVNKTIFAINENIEFYLDIPFDGYLNIINVDAHDQTTILYPNQHNPKNNIKAGKRQIPGYLLDFEIQAIEPYGDSLTVFVFTTEPLNLYQQATNVRNKNGKYVEMFAKLNQHSMRSMRVIATKQNNTNKIYTTGLTTTLK